MRWRFTALTATIEIPAAFSDAAYLRAAEKLSYAATGPLPVLTTQILNIRS